jgi:hypothetical protein
MKQRPRTLSVSPSAQDIDRIDLIVDANSPWLTRYGVHQIAFRLGLERLSADPDLAKALVAASRRNPNR